MSELDDISAECLRESFSFAGDRLYFPNYGRDLPCVVSAVTSQQAPRSAGYMETAEASASLITLDLRDLTQLDNLDDICGQIAVLYYGTLRARRLRIAGLVHVTGAVVDLTLTAESEVGP